MGQWGVPMIGPLTCRRPGAAMRRGRMGGWCKRNSRGSRAARRLRLRPCGRHPRAAVGSSGGRAPGWARFRGELEPICAPTSSWPTARALVVCAATRWCWSARPGAAPRDGAAAASLSRAGTTRNALNGGVARSFRAGRAGRCAGPTMARVLGFGCGLFGRLSPKVPWKIELHQFRDRGEGRRSGTADARGRPPRRRGLRAGDARAAREIVASGTTESTTSPASLWGASLSRSRSTRPSWTMRA